MSDEDLIEIIQSRIEHLQKIALDLKQDFSLKFETAQAAFWPINSKAFGLDDEKPQVYHVNSFE